MNNPNKGFISSKLKEQFERGVARKVQERISEAKRQAMKKAIIWKCVQIYKEYAKQEDQKRRATQLKRLQEISMKVLK